MRSSFDDPDAPVDPVDPVLLDARLPRDLARRLEGGHQPPHRSAGGATSARTSGSSTTPTWTAPSATTWPSRSPAGSGTWSACGMPRPARTRRSRSTTAARSRSSLTPRPVMSPPREPVRLLPRHRRGPRVPGGQHPQPLLRDRRAGRPARARVRRACCSPTAPGSAATPCT